MTKADVEAEIKRAAAETRPASDSSGARAASLSVDVDADPLADILGNGYETKFDRFELAQLREVAAACR